MNILSKNLILILSIVTSLVHAQRALFEAFPALQHAIAHRELRELPTPIKHLSQLGELLNTYSVYLKCDNVIGGNKVRKLEFLLADALQHDAKTVLTFGCVGSNHVLATVICAQELGLKSIGLFLPQPNSHTVRKNLMLDYAHGAHMHFSPTNAQRTEDAKIISAAYQEQEGAEPYVIPTGGSNALGALGFVNAALELKEQIEDGILPEPDKIYVALGSCGTVAGLALGLKIAGLKSTICAIAVQRSASFASTVERLFNEANQLLQAADATIPLYTLNEGDIRYVYDFSGTSYALFTPEGVEAMQLLDEAEGISLDGVYTGKACAAMLHDVRNNGASNQTILFWNTYCNHVMSDEALSHSYTELPEAFHQFFESEVQPLDQSESMAKLVALHP